MCYSKEVQLITSIIIFAAIIIYYFHWNKYLKNHHKKWLIPFLNNFLLGFLCIGGHQFFEFLSLATNNTIIYKTGLIISLSSMFFFLRALEKLSETKVHSRFALIIIIITAIFVYFTPAEFGTNLFYLQHKSAFVWDFMWMVLFIYWHLCALYLIFKYRESEAAKSSLIWFFVASLDISFILSVIYTFYGYLYHGVNVCYDAPSIWCTFFVIQVLLVPLLLNGHLKLHKEKRIKEFNTKTTTMLIIVATIIVILMGSVLPFFDCLSWKFVFP